MTVNIPTIPNSSQFKYYVLVNDTNWGKGKFKIALFNSYSKKRDWSNSKITPNEPTEYYSWEETTCKFVSNSKFTITSSVNISFYMDTNSEDIKTYLTERNGSGEGASENLSPSRVTINNPYDFMREYTRCEINPLPTPGGGGESGQTNKPCSNTGQFGGGGKPLKDIKLFLYANNVTKGTIKLSKPQVEVGTFATDWRPNPSDYVERNSPAYKEVKGLAIQHNQDQNKKYIEVQATDGTVYGVDIWGGDAKKQLEQQKAEIEELKKLVQTLETKINV